MDEQEVLELVGTQVEAAGDDAAVVGTQVITTDMLHADTDFPTGVTRYTAGWRSVGVSLSDVAAMGAKATAGLAVYAAPTFERNEIADFLSGAQDVCQSVDASYVGGDLDTHKEFTVASTALGTTTDPRYRSGARPGDAVCVTGDLGRTAAGLAAFADDEHDLGNDLFQFQPRVAAGQALAPHATAMLDSSDGLARSVHIIATASECGIALDWDQIPVHEAVVEFAVDAGEVREMACFVGEDFELVCTIPPSELDAAREACPVSLTQIGTVTEDGVTIDEEVLPDRGFSHGEE